MSSSSPRTISRLLANSRYWIGPLKQWSESQIQDKETRYTVTSLVDISVIQVTSVQSCETQEE